MGNFISRSEEAHCASNVKVRPIIWIFGGCSSITPCSACLRFFRWFLASSLGSPSWRCWFIGQNAAGHPSAKWGPANPARAAGSTSRSYFSKVENVLR